MLCDSGIPARDTGHWDTELVDRVGGLCIGSSSYTGQVSKSTCQIRKHTEDTRAFTIYMSKHEKGKRKKCDSRWNEYIV